MVSTAKVQVDVEDPPDLTDTLQQDLKRFVKGLGAFGIVYRCRCEQNGEVAVKAISLPGSLDHVERDEFVRKIRRELAIWKRLGHPNIVPFLGTADGQIFGSDYPCMVSVWMSNGTLADYVTRSETILPLPDRVRLITGSAAGLEYLHSMSIVHGDFHPGNILIGSDHIARITDFGFSQTGSPQKDLSYLWSHTTRPGAVMWVAPEIRYPDLFPDLMLNACEETKLAGDIYSFGSIILFILSGKLPWSKGELEKNTDELQNPPRPTCPVIPDVVWHFIEQCWSPRVPRNRPPAKEVLSYCTEGLQRSLQPSSNTDINIVLFGTVGCGKSSIINLLSEKSVAPVSTDTEPCTTRPRHYPISIGERRFRLWDTTGFRIPSGGDTDTLLPHKQAHALLRDLRGGIHLILLCARKDAISSSLHSLYWLINDFFFGGRGPVALIVTHFDNPDKQWWELNERFIISRTGIPVQSIPRACTTTVSTASNQSKQTLRALLANCTHSMMPVPLRLDISSHESASLNIATQCSLSNDDAVALVEEFARPQQPVNVVIFGETCVGRNSVINLLAEHPAAQIDRAGMESCTLNSSLRIIDTLAREFIVWDNAGFNGIREGHGMTRNAVLDSVELVRDLSKNSGVDLLVFVKKCGKLTESEMHCYKFFAEFICGGVPVAVVTHAEDQQLVERGWEMNGDELLKSLSGNLLGHAYITFPATTETGNSKFNARVAESRAAVQIMLEDFIFSPRGKTLDRLPTNGGRKAINIANKMTVENLVNFCGLRKDLAEDVIQLSDSEERAESLYARNIVVYGETSTGMSSIESMRLRRSSRSKGKESSGLLPSSSSHTYGSSAKSLSSSRTYGSSAGSSSSSRTYGSSAKSSSSSRTYGSSAGSSSSSHTYVSGSEFSPWAFLDNSSPMSAFALLQDTSHDQSPSTTDFGRLNSTDIYQGVPMPVDRELLDSISFLSDPVWQDTTVPGFNWVNPELNAASGSASNTNDYTTRSSTSHTQTSLRAAPDPFFDCPQPPLKRMRF